MYRALPVLLAAVLLLSVPAFAGAIAADPAPQADRPFIDDFGPEPVIEPAINISARLELPADERTGSGTAQPGIDVGAVLAGDASAVEAEFRMALLDERLDRAETDTERRNLLRATRDNYYEQLADMRDRESAAGAALAADEATPEDVLIETARIDRRASEFGPVIEHLDNRATAEPDISFNDEVRDMETELESTAGPVRAEVTRAIAGDRTMGPVHVSGAEMGTILATIDGDEYVRETVRIDNRHRGGEVELVGLTAAIDRTEALYPWTFTDRGSLSFVEASDDVYHATSSYAGGSVEIYLDRSSTNPYKEHQRLTLAQTNTIQVIDETADDLRLVVDATYPGGPARIAVTDPETGDPVDASLTVNDETIGTAGTDGTAWIVAPRGDLTVTAVDGPNEVAGTHTVTEPDEDEESDDAM